MNRSEFESLGDKMKSYEAMNNVKAIPLLPLAVRLDGRAFHTFTKGLNRPFDSNFSFCMKETTKRLVEETNATIGYTQSDEITLVFIPTNDLQELPFAGKIQKICSIFASTASVIFSRLVAEYLPQKSHLTPVFDCRAFTLPNIKLAYECLLWRETDATRNSLSMAVSSYYSPKECFKKGLKDKHDMLHEKGVNWNDYPVHFKRGTYFKRIKYEALLSEETLLKIPEKYRPTEPVIRSSVEEVFNDILSISQLTPEQVFHRE